MATGVVLQDSANRGISEIGASPAQTQQIKQGCIGQALGPLPAAQKNQISVVCDNLQDDLATAADNITSQRAAISTQRDNLNSQISAYGNANQNVSDFIRLANPAVQACQAVAQASQTIKAVEDLNAARESELQYQLILLSTLDADLQVQQQSIQTALSTLDDVRGALIVGA